MLRQRWRETRVVFVLLSACILFSTFAHAQKILPLPPRQPQSHEPRPRGEEVEAARFKAILAAKDLSRKIQLAEQFLNDYPVSLRKEVVFDQLMDSYYQKQDWDHFYSTTDRALTADPNDVDVLTLAGWVIPHNYDPKDANAAMKLAKAEQYEVRAIELIPNLHKPANVSQEQFDDAKTKQLAQAHSGLGLVYFRMQNWEGATKEFQAVTQMIASPDPADLFAYALGLQQLHRYDEAVTEFHKCSETPSDLQTRCKESEDKLKALIERPAPAK